MVDPDDCGAFEILFWCLIFINIINIINVVL